MPTSLQGGEGLEVLGQGRTRSGGEQGSGKGHEHARAGQTHRTLLHLPRTLRSLSLVVQSDSVSCGHQGDVYVEPFASNAALGTVLVTDQHRIAASGRIESVQRR